MDSDSNCVANDEIIDKFLRMREGLNIKKLTLNETDIFFIMV